MRFLTPRRIRLYPAITLAVLVTVAFVNRVAGTGMQEALSGSVGGDFMAFYTGGSFAAQGRFLDLLDPGAQLDFQQGVLGHHDDRVSLWVSPPYAAWLFVPLARLPYLWAYVGFVALGGAALGAALKALGAELTTLPATPVLAWIALQYYPTLQWLLNGQTTMLWLCLLTVAFVQLRRGHDLRAGLLLGCFACKPPLALGVVVALLAARRWAALAGVAASTFVWLGVGMLTMPQAMKAYVSSVPHLASVVRDPGYPVVGLHGSFEFALLLLDDRWPDAAVALGAGLTLALLGGVARLWLRRPWRPGSRAWDLRMGATLALGLIASPHLYGYDLALLLLPLFVVAAHYEPRAPETLPLDGGPLLASTAGVWALGLAGPALSLAQQYATRSLFGFAVAVQVGVIAVVLWAYRVLARAEGTAPEERTS